MWFRKYVVIFASVIFEILDVSCHMHSITVKTFNGLYLVAEYTSRTLLLRRVLNVDKCVYKESIYCIMTTMIDHMQNNFLKYGQSN